ncbi:MAG: hypothetical protein JKY51_09560 [Opitutaceae bacterium]|nr:hypothetical protein [Opitutaceae bacterium]
MKKNTPKIVHMANLWSLVGYPPKKKEWDIERKLVAIKEAGFGAITTLLTPKVGKLAKKHGLGVVGFFSSAKLSEMRGYLEGQRDAGAYDINVQVGDHDTTTTKATALAIRLMAEAKKIGVQPTVEIHRDTCTETPEKTYALADAYRKETGEILPMTLDFSHISVVKHLAPEDYTKRLIERKNIVQRAPQIHFRPFNGHHCQVPVTDGKGRLTPEVKDCLAFLEDLFTVWQKGRFGHEQLYVCPEMGPVAGGYNFHSLPNSWEEAIVLRKQIDKVWKKVSKAS